MDRINYNHDLYPMYSYYNEEEEEEYTNDKFFQKSTKKNSNSNIYEMFFQRFFIKDKFNFNSNIYEKFFRNLNNKQKIIFEEGLKNNNMDEEILFLWDKYSNFDLYQILKSYNINYINNKVLKNIFLPKENFKTDIYIYLKKLNEKYLEGKLKNDKVYAIIQKDKKLKLKYYLQIKVNEDSEFCNEIYFSIPNINNSFIIPKYDFFKDKYILYTKDPEYKNKEIEIENFTLRDL